MLSGALSQTYRHRCTICVTDGEVSRTRDCCVSICKYSGVSFYDDSLSRPLSSRTGHSRLVVHHFFFNTCIFPACSLSRLNPLTPNNLYSGRTSPLTSKRFILYIYSTNTGTEYFKHGIHSPFFSLSLQNAVCLIILTYLVPFFHILYTVCVKI